MKIKIALLQLKPTGTAEENYLHASKNIKKASELGANIILLPELWNIGYSSPEDYLLGKETWEKDAYEVGDVEFKKYQELSKIYKVAIALPFLEKNTGGSFSDSVSLIDRKGEVVFTYRKAHTVDEGWEVIFTSGENFPVADLYITDNEFVKVGTMICYDREFPEVGRILMLNGAELILIPNACDIENNRIAQLQTRAFENMYAVAMANYPNPKYNGQSIAFDGMREKGVDYDPLMVRADDTEGIWYAELDTEKLRAYRAKEIWGDAYRKPRLYNKLIENNPKHPFLRAKAKR